MSTRPNASRRQQPSGLRFDRRRFLQAMGLGGLALSSGSLSLPNRARAGGFVAPTRVVFFITPHGTVWNHWKVPIAGAPDPRPDMAATVGASRSLMDLPESEWPEILRPLQMHASKLQVVEGFGQLTTLLNERDAAEGEDVNRHHIAQANLLTCAIAMQRPGATAFGNAISVDQHMGQATRGSRTWASRVYGQNHQHPYSFVAPGEAAPIVYDAGEAFADIMGAYVPPTTGGPTRADLLRVGRGSALDLVASEYDRIAPRLSGEDRRKLERHRDLVRDLERSFQGTGSAAMCDPRLVPSACDADIHACATGADRCRANVAIDDFAQVIALALSCDLTRVVNFQAPNLPAHEFGLECDANVHQNYAHNSIEGSGGAAYTPEAEAGMVAYNRTYARHFARLLTELDSIPEGDGTLLDHTAVVWISELGTGTHEVIDLPVVIAGGQGVLGQGRYVRLPSDRRFEARWGSRPYVGASTNQLYATLMHFLGMPDDGFGLRSLALSPGGETLSLTGVRSELLA
ncbi:MAG: DUF1552 domain-containing protein [Deltaproteobacteria bacterium]|nr:DUF1552 domain-containing protein [Deltaproteobacteria bacterium]